MTTIIGIDCACDSRKTGIAVADYASGRASVRYAATGLSRDELGAMIVEVVARATTVLLALDAPLGWPAALGDRLASHRAGDPLAGSPDALFRRDTDRFVHRTAGRLPLDVGADRIARTAKAALDLLAEVRTATGQPIPLAWSPELATGAWAIEVYPAATLKVHGARDRGYKLPDAKRERREIVAVLGHLLDLPKDRSPLLGSADALDAVVCVLAAADFLSGRCTAPTDWPTAEREGWIWVRGLSEGREEPIERADEHRPRSVRGKA
jgi:predicted RNase H-like nuclease